MKRAIKKQSNLYTFLEPFLEAGNEDAIVQARKDYWKQYKKNWKQQKRQEQRTFEVSFNKQEWSILKQLAITYSGSHARFIKQAALAYCQQTYLIPDQLAYNNIQQALTMLYNKLKDMEADNKLSPTASQQILQLFFSVEAKIEQQLKYPKTLEEAIIEVINNNPEYKARLSKLLSNIS